MNKTSRLERTTILLASLGSVVLALSAVVVPELRAQGPQMQQRLAEVKDSMAVNKMLLAQYKWMEQDVISIKGEEKKEELYYVQLGPDGKPQKTPADPNSVSDNDRQQRGIRGRIRDRMTEEYQDYAQKIKSLIQDYIPPDKGSLQAAYQQGNVMIGPMGGSPGQYRVVINNYMKQGDNMTLVMDSAQKDLVSLSISSYLSDPKDAVTVSAQFSRIPGGPNHAAKQTINGVSKHLTIAVQDFNYQHM